MEDDKRIEIPSFMQGEEYQRHLDERRKLEEIEARREERQENARIKRKQVAKRKKVAYTVFVALVTMLIAQAAETGKEVVVGTEMLKSAVYHQLEHDNPYYWMDYSDGLHFYKDGTSEEVPYSTVCDYYRSRLDQMDLTDAEKAVGVAVLPYSVENDVFNPEDVSLADKCAAARGRYQYEKSQEVTEEYESGRGSR